MILQTLPLSGCYGKQNVFSFFVNPVIVLVFCLFFKKETNKKTSFMFSGICGNTIRELLTTNKNLASTLHSLKHFSVLKSCLCSS